MDDLVVGTGPLAPGEVVDVARRGRRVVLSPAARDRMAAMRAHVDAKRDADEIVYGITTGFGALAKVHVPPADVRQLQHNLVRSHAAGAGPLLEPEVVRAMTLLRARTLATGHPGVRPRIAERLVAMLNADITPAVPSRGSVGASGDLAQLAHVGLCAIGEGRALTEGGGTEPAAEALGRAGLEPLPLEAKEGLALVNGTEGMLALGLLAADDLASMLTAADVTAAMTIEAALGTDRPFAEDLMALTAAPRTGRERREPPRAAGREPDHGEPRGERPRGPGSVLDAVRAAGARRRAGRVVVRRGCLRPRARRRDGQPDRPRGRTGRERRQLPRRAARLRARSARDRGDGPGQHQRAADRVAPRAGRHAGAAGAS